jgi:hypothetical protein
MLSVQVDAEPHPEPVGRNLAQDRTQANMQMERASRRLLDVPNERQLA